MLLWGHFLGVPPPPPPPWMLQVPPFLWCEVASTFTPKPQGGSGGGEGRRWPREDFPRMREGSGSSFWAPPPPPSTPCGERS